MVDERRFSVSRLALTAAALSVCASCSSESLAPTYEAKFALEAKRHPELVAELDGALKAYGLQRFGAAPGLNEVRNREVLYVEYRPDRASKWAYLTASDIAVQNVIQLRIYPEVLQTSSHKADALTSIQAVLTRYGAALQPARRGA